ncbi:MAG: gluconate 2-dehydrogenase subunit 3 family protein [Flammeovirgaceae bacterium]|jgi:hypothetical protein|nr:gluconate 2-dehydrogenase subunit 3 family protein [Flammeovirgaceae bacterium]|tara:strand:- start:331 stop:1035 length:705 start_codon:yes stop_codon:yes gene_type:complete
MDRRESIKSLLVGSLAGGLMVSGCAPNEEVQVTQDVSNSQGYGRTKKEQKRDAQLMGEQFLSEHEIDTISILCDIILPKSSAFQSALDAQVPAFIEFIVKDMPIHQLSIRGGIMWLDNWSNTIFENDFATLSVNEQHILLDQIAYPEEAKPSLLTGVKFFSRMRNLTLTGFYTTSIGISELGYKGNTPNIWDGVPEEVLEAHGLAYEPEWLRKCVDQDKRMDIAEWDEKGKLLT